jgi:hypothetical protein
LYKPDITIFHLPAIKAKGAAMRTPEVSAAIKKGFEELRSAKLLENTL